MKEQIEERLDFCKNELEIYKKYRSIMTWNALLEIEDNIKDLEIRIDELNILLRWL